jgi:hypothetical protein
MPFRYSEDLQGFEHRVFGSLHDLGRRPLPLVEEFREKPACLDAIGRVAGDLQIVGDHGPQTNVGDLSHRVLLLVKLAALPCRSGKVGRSDARHERLW